MKTSSFRNLTPARLMLGVALTTVLASAIAQSSSAPSETVNPLMPAQVLVPATEAIVPVISAPPASQMSPPPPASASAADPLEALQRPPAPVAQAPTAPSSSDRPASQMVSPYNLPPAGPGIFQGSDQTFREISYLRAETDLSEARTAREEALLKQVDAYNSLLEATTGKPKPSAQAASGQGSSSPDVATPEQIQAAAAAKAKAEAIRIATTPYVNSIYMYGEKAYAEIVLGSTWVMASQGTQLVNGDRVVSISQAGVVVAGKNGRRRTLPVRGSAAIN